MTVVETYDPTGTLKPVAEGVWIVDGPMIRFGCLGLRFCFPTHMTVARLADGGLSVHLTQSGVPLASRNVTALLE